MFSPVKRGLLSSSSSEFQTASWATENARQPECAALVTWYVRLVTTCWNIRWRPAISETAFWCSLQTPVDCNVELVPEPVCHIECKSACRNCVSSWSYACTYLTDLTIDREFVTSAKKSRISTNFPKLKKFVQKFVKCPSGRGLPVE